MHDKKDNKKDANKDAKEETKQATTSVVAGTSTPGAIHVDALSSKGQQAFQNTPLIDGPSQWPQKRENRSDPPGLSFNRKLTKRAAASSLARIPPPNDHAPAKKGVANDYTNVGRREGAHSTKSSTFWMKTIIGLILILMFLWTGFALQHFSPEADVMAPLLHRSTNTTSKPNVRSMLANEIVTPTAQRDNKHVLAESDNGTITPASSPKTAHTDLHNDEPALVAAVPPPSPPVLPLEPLKPPVPGNTSSRIPHKMWFTYSHNLQKMNDPSLLAANVRHTIDAYRQAWDEPSAEINVYNDTMCRALLQKVEPLLLVYFDNEKKGLYRGAICRTAILYMFGGYYFDLDLEVITPVLLKDSDTFATVRVKRNNFFHGFLAGTPKHPIFRKALDLMLEYYKSTRKPNGWMGIRTMQAAVDSVVESATTVERGGIILLEEVNGGNELFPRLEGWTKRENAKGCCCDFVVHDGTTPFFYSHIVGVDFCQTPISR